MSIPTQIAETIQTAHIQRNPSPLHDLVPSTAASETQPVKLVPAATPESAPAAAARPSSKPLDASIDLVDDDDAYAESDIPVSVLKPRPRTTSFPPMPDLRFEQSYLHSIRNADSWWKVALITLKDQMLAPLAQGLLYNVAMLGWQHWNRNAQFNGSSVGARARRWWYGVNNWAIPERTRKRG